jgi:glycosyltransferase involved in cell wall biosynthesis
MFKLEYICFTNITGYGQAAFNTISALSQDDRFDVKVTPLDLNFKDKSAVSRTKFKELIRKPNSPDRIQIFHCIPPLQRRFKRHAVAIGVATYETWEPPKNWIAILNTNNGVIVPSRFNSIIFAPIRKHLFYIPHCLDMNKYSPDVKPMHSWDKFTFLFLGAWRQRKNYERLLEAWGKEFTGRDDVQLVIKTDRIMIATAAVKKLRYSIRCPVIVHDQMYSEDDMPAFIKSADCLVLPTLGEGFGYPGLQAMALGVPVIISNHSGCRDYATEERAFLLQPEGRIRHKTMDGYAQFTNKQWIHISTEQIQQMMRYVYAHQKEAQEKAQQVIAVRRQFGYDAVRKAFLDMLAGVLSKD